MTRVLLEVCVDSAAGLAAARAGGADRIELCSALALGGLSPSTGLIALAVEVGLPVTVMVRPRAGAFVWSAEERRAMESEIAAVRAAGLAGVAIGASQPDGRLDVATLAAFVAVAKGLEVTLHRAIDLDPDPDAAIDSAAALGIRRVLSSGGAAIASEGLGRLGRMQRRAGDRLTVMPGGGIRAATLPPIAAHLVLTEVHASCAAPLPQPADPRLTTFGFQPPEMRETDREAVADLRRALDQLTA